MPKRLPLNKDIIVSKAIEIADKGGLIALSMRNLATELEIQAMSLYHHFQTKEELISYMADKLLTDLEALDSSLEPQDWRSIMQRRAQAAKELFREHPWLPLVIDSQVHSGIRRLTYLNDYIGTLRRLGLPIELTLKVTSLVDSYIYGYCLQLSHMANPDKSPEELAEAFSHGFDASEFPYLSEATALVMKQGYDAEADFLFGLNVILNGISLELDNTVR